MSPAVFPSALLALVLAVPAVTFAQMRPVDDTSASARSSSSLASAAISGARMYTNAPGTPVAPAAPAPAGPTAAAIMPALPYPSVQNYRPFSLVAIGLRSSTLGAGAEMATPLSPKLNLRVGGSYFNYNVPFAIDGVNYGAGFKFTAGQATVDWFPNRGAFHLSPGVLYFQNVIGGAATVVEGGNFTLGGKDYVNSVDDPVHGTATFGYSRQIAPMLLMGFGNVLPRGSRRFSMPIELGAAYMGLPTVDVKLVGTACTRQGCFNAATDPTAQSSLKQEISDLNNKARFLQLYPILSLGFALRF